MNTIDFDSIDQIIDSNNDELIYLMLNVISYLFRYMQDKDQKKRGLKYATHAEKIIKNDHLNSPLFLPAIHFYKEL